MKTANDDVANRELRITKTLKAPVEWVWKVWTTPEHIVNWWGPNGFTNTIHTMDVTEGGEWRLTMHGPDGKNYPNKSIFIEIVNQQKIVFQHFNPNYIATVVFVPSEKETLVEWTMLFETTELFEAVVNVFKADEGLKQNVEKLTAYIETQLDKVTNYR
jgi:uncharacterized protein YndB with AHSA1/START domain